MTQLVFDPIAFAWGLAGLVLGLLIGRLAWGGRRRVVAVADTAAIAATRAAAEARADQTARELATAHAALRPLADEVDRLKRDLARAQRPVQAPLPLGTTAPAALPVTPLHEPGATVAVDVSPTIVGSRATSAPDSSGLPAVAGTGPIVVGVPDIRQLKGVGDKFAAALTAIGLGTIDRLARLTADEALDADGRLGAFNGRLSRDRLVEQATLLDEGRTTEYETRFGKL